MKAINISWYTDSEKVELPKEMDIPASVENDFNSGNDEAIENYLSATTGGLVFNYTLID